MRGSVFSASVLLLLVATGCYEEPVAMTTFPPSAGGTPIGFPPSPAATQTPGATPSPELTPSPSTAPPTATASATASLTSTPTTGASTTPAPTASASTTPAPSASATPAITSSPTLAAGSPGIGCVNGWTAPAVGSAEYEAGLAILSGHLGVDAAWAVHEMRYFTGPELPNVEPQYLSVERWYVRGALAADPDFRGRFLVERRTEEIAGISAVAPYASTGYASPDWTGFVGEGPPTTYLGLPGQWSGIPYDFVTGAGDGGFPGLPEEVAGCLSGT